YAGHIGADKFRDHYGKNSRLLSQLIIEHLDGSNILVATDGSWKANTGPILEGDFLAGETYDARLEMVGWDEPGFNAGDWTKVDVTDKIKTKVEAYPSNTIQVFQEIKPLSVKEPMKGNFVFDMGTNFAGVVRLKVRGDKGRKITLRFGERLKEDGTVYTANLREARVIDTYICKGQGVEVWQPKFTFHGFQYVQMTGFAGKPGRDAITGIELTSATPVTGIFECSDPRLNHLYHNICQTQRANFIDVPTDCPQRDERLGWTGDAQAYIRTACLNADVQSFFRKWFVNLTDAQLENGDFPKVAPAIGNWIKGSGGPAWADAGIICPWAIYEVYGDKVVLEKHYEAMKKFVEFRFKSAPEHLAPEKFDCYGGWRNIDANTPKDVIYTAYTAGDAQIMAKIAAVLGKDADVAKFNKLSEDIKYAFNNAYVKGDGTIKEDTQTAYILALWFDLVDDQMKEKVEMHLIDRIKERDWHLSTGFVGTRDLMHVLTKIGRTDVAYRLLFTDTYPSWLFPVKNGATSIWERWDSWTPEKGFGDVGMNSFSHYTYGSVGQWMFENIGGIKSVKPGYKEIVIRPYITGQLTWAKTSYDSIHGLIAVDWKRKGQKVTLKVSVPANVKAVIHVPKKKEPVEVGSGVYTFKSEIKKLKL
ncbi:MAG: family 78 glycoside hydrolase catalytic domain, partial [Planctomycetota bacterium]